MTAKEITLFVNLDGVRIGPVHVHAYALVLSTTPASSVFPEMRRAQGFLTELSLPTFDLRLSSLDYELDDAASADMVSLEADGTLMPLCAGSILKFKDGLELQLIASDRRRSIDVLAFDTLEELGHAIPRLVCEYWIGRGIPTASWVLVDDLRNRGFRGEST